MQPAHIYIPDTSAIVENPDALDRLLQPGNVVILLRQVLDELGRLQSSRNKSEGVRTAARTATRKILAYRTMSVIHHDVHRLLSGELPLEAFTPTPAGACWPGNLQARGRRWKARGTASSSPRYAAFSRWEVATASIGWW